MKWIDSEYHNGLGGVHGTPVDHVDLQLLIHQSHYASKSSLKVTVFFKDFVNEEKSYSCLICPECAGLCTPCLACWRMFCAWNVQCWAVGGQYCARALVAAWGFVLILLLWHPGFYRGYNTGKHIRQLNMWGHGSAWLFDFLQIIMRFLKGLVLCHWI